MRADKLITQFESALADAQSLTLAADHGYIEPVHLSAAPIAQTDGSGRRRSGIASDSTH